MNLAIRAVFFCTLLLVSLSAFLLQTSAQKDDVVTKLLNLPAPPPPNPLVPKQSQRPTDFYNKSKNPKDDADINELYDYWYSMSSSYSAATYSPEPSDVVVARLKKLIENDPKKLPDLLNVFRKDKDGYEFVKDIYDAQGDGGVFDKDTRSTIKTWLTYNSPYFSDELATTAADVRDADNYVTNQAELLALARFDFNKAKPIIDRLMLDPNAPASRALAKWALYKNALATDSLGDIERYRDELKDIVADKTAADGVRDLAMDALTHEKEWSGRDDWYVQMMADETLVKMQRFTGLTTLINVSPDDKYIDKMIELLKSSDPNVRGAAIRNLSLKLDSGNPELVRALLPWLENPRWAVDNGGVRESLVRKLAEIKMPEAVPALIGLIDEKGKARVYGVNSANTAVNSNVATRPSTPAETEIDTTVLRAAAVQALSYQRDARAAGRLRRLLNETGGYERTMAVGAALACGGFTIGEQMDALEQAATGVRGEMDDEEALAAATAANLPANTVARATNVGTEVDYSTNKPQPLTPGLLKTLIASELMSSKEISDPLASALVTRISQIDRSNPRLAEAYRRIALKWPNTVINSFLILDLQNSRANVDTVVRLLAHRKTLLEKHSSDLAGLSTGPPAAVGIAACINNNESSYMALIDNENADARAAMYACARMLRAQLPVARVAGDLASENKRLALAAERYLVSEDSPEARAAVLARKPGQAFITGAASAFIVEGVTTAYSEYLWELYASVDDQSMYNGWDTSMDESLLANEKRLKKEVVETADLLGVYSYDNHYIRIYGDRVIFSWDEDENRYRERPLTNYEFEQLKVFLADNDVGNLKPFLSCGGEYCDIDEFLMLGKNGGRRVFRSGTDYPFFNWLDKYFKELKQTPAVVKYAMSREVPGLELLIADDAYDIVTVWNQGGQLIAASGDTATRERVEREINFAVTGKEEPEDDGVYRENSEEEYEKRRALEEKRQWEGYSWRIVGDGTLLGEIPQPADNQAIPHRDGYAIQADGERWKSRVGTVEYRTSEEGLFRLSAGRLTKLKDGNYSGSLVTPNGKWLIVAKADAEYSWKTVRIDTATLRETVIVTPEYTRYVPTAYSPVLDKVLLIQRSQYEYYATEEPDMTPPDYESDQMLLLDCVTGQTFPVKGEFRPLAHQSFRQLQKTARPNEYWAAIMKSDRSATEIGVYDTKFFTFKPLVKLPKIAFNSMDMYVDEVKKKIFFVYRGHLLSVPLPG